MELADPTPPLPAPEPAPPPSPPGPRSTLRPVLRVVVLMYGVVTLFAFGFALFAGDIGVFLGDQAPTLAELFAGLAVGGLLCVATLVGERVWSPFRRAAHALAEVLGPVTVREALLIAAVSGVAEELLFRGALWPTLGFWGTSVLFGIVHVVPLRALWIYPVFATGAGFVLGLLRETTGSVLPPLLAHVALNAINLIWIGRRARSLAATAAPSA